MAIKGIKQIMVQDILLDFFRKAGRAELPWRREGISAYEVWVSEVMLQQTQVSRVVEYYTKFLERFPMVHDLARASWEEFLPYYAGLGYYARGRNMLRTAEIIVAEYDGKFPQEVVELQKLPGVGPYTAAAIASFTYGAETLAWDTNLRRVVGRVFFGTRFAEATSLEEIGKRFAAPAREMNAALMDFGSAICLSKPKCGQCPLSGICRYFREGGRKEAVTKKQKEKTKQSSQKDLSGIIVVLHERHRRYFSSTKRLYRPFFVEATRFDRNHIKAFFCEKYQLEIAVRPPHTRGVSHGKDIVIANAQILMGACDFAVFPKTAVLRYTEKEIHSLSSL